MDARCISGHPAVAPNDAVYYQKKVRCHNRQLHKATILKGGIRKNNQAPQDVKGFRLFDTVRYKKNTFLYLAEDLMGSLMYVPLIVRKSITVH